VGIEPYDAADTLSRKILFREYKSTSYYLYALALFGSTRTGAKVWGGVVIGIRKILLHVFLWSGDIRL
jgi:hypothetical protein